MKLIAGLGNPGHVYEGSRHNVGFDVLEILAVRSGCPGGPGGPGLKGEPGLKAGPGRRQRFQGEIAQVTIRGCQTLLLWPLTWMNLSGGSVLAARDFYKIDDSDILVVCDDFNLPTDVIRLRKSGSAGGQNGLADVLVRLGTQSVPRLRVGIGPVPRGRNPADWVLGRFSPAERPLIDSLLQRAADAAEDWVALGIDAAMNRHN